MKTNAVAVERAYDLALWLLPKSERFPRSYRATLGQRLVNAMLDLQQSLVKASFTRDKRALLEAAQQQVNLLNVLIRLAKDLQLVSVDSYGFAAEKLAELGRMIHGWAKSLGGSPAESAS